MAGMCIEKISPTATGTVQKPKANETNFNYPHQFYYETTNSETTNSETMSCYFSYNGTYFYIFYSDGGVVATKSQTTTTTTTLSDSAISVSLTFTSENVTYTITI